MIYFELCFTTDNAFVLLLYILLLAIGEERLEPLLFSLLMLLVVIIGPAALRGGFLCRGSILPHSAQQAKGCAHALISLAGILKL